MPPRPQPFLRTLASYKWEASAAEVACEAGIPESAIVRFDTNTAPWPPVAWEQTVVDLPRLPINEYPHPSNEPLRSALAGKLQVTREQVVVTCGADEALYLLALAFVGPGRHALVPTPSFSMFWVATETSGGQVRELPLDERWHIPEAGLFEAMDRPDVSLVWLCSPNNPTGQLVDAGLVAEAAGQAPDTLFVVDEAYYEFAGVTLAPLLARHRNLVLVRTFSKAYGLAGARVGYLVGDASITRLVDGLRPPQNLTTFGVQAASRALADEAGMLARVEEIRHERERLSQALQERGWDVVPSRGNFFLARPPRDALEVSRWLRGAGLIVRSYGQTARLKDLLRLTVRAPEENNRLLARLDAPAV